MEAGDNVPKCDSEHFPQLPANIGPEVGVLCREKFNEAVEYARFSVSPDHNYETVVSFRARNSANRFQAGFVGNPLWGWFLAQHVRATETMTLQAVELLRCGTGMIWAKTCWNSTASYFHLV